MKNRIAATLLAFCLVLALLPGTAMADQAVDPYIKIWYTEDLFSNFVEFNPTTVTKSLSGDGWSYSPTTKTLTLSGFNGNRISIYRGGAITITLVGDNICSSLGLADASVSGDNNRATISGNGTLALKHMTVQFNTTMKSGTITISRDGLRVMGTCGVVTLAGGTIDTTNTIPGQKYTNSCGLDIGANSSFHITGGTLIASGNDFGISGGKSFSYTSGTVIAHGGKAALWFERKTATWAGAWDTAGPLSISGTMTGGRTANDTQVLSVYKASNTDYEFAVVSASKLTVGNNEGSEWAATSGAAKYVRISSQAQTQPKNYTVTFNPNGGTTSTKSKTVTNGSTYGTLPTPTRTGYTFNGWYTSSTGGTKITSTSKVTKTANHTLYAQWTKKQTMTVTFNANGGTTATKSKSVTNGSTYGTLPTPTRTGYTFNGWYTSSTGGTKITSTSKVTKTANHTLYAQWTKKQTMTVTFNANGGTTTTKSKSVTNGSTYGTLPTPTRTGYKFDGWYTSSSGGTKITSATKVTKTGNHTIYAHWSKRNFTVTLDANGGTLLTDTIVATLGTRYRSLPTPTRAGYHFNGWYTAKTGGTKVTAATKATSVKTLYARWGTAAPSVKSRQSGSYRIVIPEDYKVLLYSSETTAAVTRTAAEQTGEYVVTCTKMVKLSNDTVRYYGKFSKVSSTTSYWFTYSDEMYID